MTGSSSASQSLELGLEATSASRSGLSTSIAPYVEDSSAESPSGKSSYMCGVTVVTKSSCCCCQRTRFSANTWKRCRVLCFQYLKCTPIAR